MPPGQEPTMSRRFVTLNVFTDRRFTGNPLAVVLEAVGLDTATMQTIAREFGHRETTFVLQPATSASRAKVRIFTPTRELAFAGHPTVGTAVLLGQIDGGGQRAMVVEEGIGPVSCTIESTADGHGRARFMLPQLPVTAGVPPDDATLADALGLAPADISFDGLR